MHNSFKINDNDDPWDKCIDQALLKADDKYVPVD